MVADAVTLQSAIEDALPLLQAEALARMTDTCIITKPGTGARGPINSTTGKYDSSPADVTVYEGMCRLGRIEIPHITQAAGGEATWNVQDSVLHLPMVDTDDVAAGQSVEYLSSSANPGLVGRKFGILGVVAGTNLTARRCIVREVVS
jgi:hypothetical protein